MTETITLELKNVYDSGLWFWANKLLLNANKTKLIVFSSRKCRRDLSAPPVILNDVELKQVTNESFLGVQVDKTLKWYEHTCKISNCISRKIGMMSRIKNFVSQKTLKTIYNSLIQPHLIYGITLWGRTFDKGRTRIIKLQKKAIRLITGRKRTDHCEPRQKQLRILKLEDLYRMHTNRLTYDCLNGESQQKPGTTFLLHRSIRWNLYEVPN
jgi:hypothetical protein